MLNCTGPIQTVIVSSRADLSIFGKQLTKDNLITVAWHMPISFGPPLYAISIGKTRFSLELIRKSKVFVVNFMPYYLREKLLVCGTKSGRLLDKFHETGLGKEEASSIDCCKVVEAVAQLECEVVQEIEAGDHVIFVGKVLRAIEKNTSEKRPFQQGKEFTTTV